jgi:hypothetical protein
MVLIYLNSMLLFKSFRDENILNFEAFHSLLSVKSLVNELYVSFVRSDRFVDVHYRMNLCENIRMMRMTNSKTVRTFTCRDISHIERKKKDPTSYCINLGHMSRTMGFFYVNNINWHHQLDYMVISKYRVITFAISFVIGHKLALPCTQTHIHIGH